MNERARTMRRRLSYWLLGAGFLGVTAMPGTARADEEGSAGFLLDFNAGYARIADEELRESEPTDTPDPLKNKHFRIDGPRRFYGGSLNLLARISQFRFGFGFGAFSMDDARIRHDALPAGLRANATTYMGFESSMFAGAQFVRKPVSPYIDLKAKMIVLPARVELHHESLGKIGYANFDTTLFDIGPRLGILVPIGDVFAFHASASFGLLDVERASISLGIGTFSP